MTEKKTVKIDTERIREELGNSVDVFYFEEIDSTNAEGKRRFREGLHRPALLIAERQTAGRGRLGRSFYSPEDTGIYMTMAFPTRVPLYTAVRTTAKTAVAVLCGIQSVMNAALSVKWVNDIYMGSRKVAGILVESVILPESGQTEQTDGLVIGIGINVSTQTFPDELKDTAGALTSGSCDRNLLIVQIVKHLLYEVTHFDDLSYLEIYRGKSCVLGREILYGQAPDFRCGRAVSIDDSGALIVLNEQGETERLTGGEISVRLKN